jgi:glycosyltransferase involved in cell wall biosynthesis
MPVRRPLLVQTFTVSMSLRFLEGQVPFWQQQGYEVQIITHSDSYAQNFCRINNASLIHIPFQRSISLLTDVWCLIKLMAHFLRSRPQIVHGNTPKAAFLSMIAAWFTGVPVRVYEMHGLPLETARGAKRWLLWLIEWLSCKLASQVVAISASLKAKAIDEKLTTPNKIVVLQNGSCNGVDSEQLFNPENYQQDALRIPTIGFVGRLTIEKGICELMEAWPMVKQTYPEAQLMMIGDEDSRNPLPAYFYEQFKTDSSIRWLGFVENTAQYYASISFLVLPSHREGLGNVILEAAAMGKPTIGTKVTGICDAILPYQTGLLCEPYSAVSLAENICYYLQHPEIVQAHGKAAHTRASALFSPPIIWEAKANLYLQLQQKMLPLPYVSSILKASH